MTYNHDLNQLKQQWKTVEEEETELQFPIPDGPQFPPGAVPIPISSTARQKAAGMANLCRKADLKEIMRRNLLATIAVHDYLSFQGYLPDLRTSDCWNPILGRTGEVSDLVISQVGRFECCAINPGEPICSVPSEGQFRRSGYVAVEMDKEERWGWLLGFVPGGNENNAVETLGRNELQSMDKLGEHLYRLWGLSVEGQITEKKVNHRTLVNLSQWFDDVFEREWQTINLLTSSNEFFFAPRTRDVIQAQINQQDRSVLVARAWKVVELEQSDQKIPLVLILTITPQSQQEGVEIRLRVYPGSNLIYLLPDVHLSIQDELSTEIFSIRSGKEDNWLQGGFFGQPGEAFSINLMLGDSSISESFRI
jgi:Protein of unknown function (DUF1822)